jgi:hypothetical protein
MKAAIAVLENALEVVEKNEPINRAEGNTEQADLEAGNAEEFRAAICTLNDAMKDCGDGPGWAAG